MKIFLDMDGVIANFDKAYSAIYGLNARDDPDKSHWYEFVDNNGFETLEWMPGGQDLINYLTNNYTVEILSCIGNRSNAKNVAAQKMRWLSSKQFGHLPTNFEYEKKDKSKFAKFGILIDDSTGCVEPFREAGGIAIQHKSYEQTLQELKCIMSKKDVRNNRDERLYYTPWND